MKLPLELQKMNMKHVQCQQIHTHCRTQVDMTHCEVCRSGDMIELHHWGSQALFPNADQWPVSYLCRKCHVLWHQKMVIRRESDE